MGGWVNGEINTPDVAYQQTSLKNFQVIQSICFIATDSIDVIAIDIIDVIK